MADQTHDPRFEKLLRDVLAAEVANLPLAIRPSQILELAEARRRARARSRLRLLIFGEPTGGLRQLSVALGAIAVLAVAGALAFATLRLDRTPVAAPLPTTPDAWSPVVLDAGPNAQNVTRIAASSNRLLAVVDVQDGPAELFASTDGQSWTQVPPDAHPAIGSDGAGWALTSSDRGFLLSNGDIWSSADGFDWQPLAKKTDNPDLGHGEMLGVVAGGPGYVAVGNGNSAWYSTDGSEWSLAQVPQPPTQFFESQGFAAPEVDMRGIAVAGDKLVAWGTASRHTEDSGLTAAVIWTSQDGRTWSNVLDPRDGEGPNAMAAGPGGLAAVFDDADHLVVRVSTDGSTWEQVADLGAARSEDADGMPLDLEVSAIAASDAGFVAAGGFGPRCLMAGVPCGPDEALIWTSADGRSWSRLPKGKQFAHAGASDVVAWEDRFVVGGAQNGRPVIWISNTPAATETPNISPTPLESPEPRASATLTSETWPQSSLDAVRQAQELADAGDPAYTWQVEPRLTAQDQGDPAVTDPQLWGYLTSQGAEIVERFLREELGWEDFLFTGRGGTYADADALRNLVYVRCVPGETNPLYPIASEWQLGPRLYPIASEGQLAPRGNRCAPTIDELAYEAVSLDLSQPDRQGSDGIWVVSRGTTTRFVQADPRIVGAQLTTRLEDFLRARIEGSGADGYIEVFSFVGPEHVPLLYAATSGAPYERFEIDRVGEPSWPDADMRFVVRLFAGGGSTVVEQPITVLFDDGLPRFHLIASQTTENGQPLPEP